MPVFPLPTDYFRCPSLGQDDIDRLIQLGQTTAYDVMSMYTLNNTSIEWTINTDDNILQIYEGKKSSDPSNLSLWMVHTELQGSIDSVASAYTSTTTNEFREKISFFQRDVVDGIVLYSIPQPDEIWTGIRWTAHKSSAPTIVNLRDSCILERQEFYNDIDGNRCWLSAFRSITLGSCPDLYDTLGLVRMEFLSCGIRIIPSKKTGFLRIEQLFHMDVKGNIPIWIMRLRMKERCCDAGNIQTYLDAYRLSKISFLTESQLIPKHTRNSCYLCSIKFGPFTKKSQCRKCGEVVCRNCSKKWLLRITGIQISKRICTKCVLNYHHDDDDDEYLYSECDKTTETIQSSVITLENGTMDQFELETIDPQEYLIEMTNKYKRNDLILLEDN